MARYNVTTCDICGDDLVSGQYQEFELPMRNGNPYPDSVYACNKPECIEKAKKECDDQWESEQNYEDEEEDD